MIELKERTEQHVKMYYEKTQDAEIKDLLPSSAKTLEDALRMYMETKSESAKSIGKTIYYNGEYVGDIWCYGLWEEPDAMLSYCIFEKKLWGKGIATEAVRLFVEFLRNDYHIKTIGAFTYRNNIASVRVLNKNGFALIEQFEDAGRASVYLEKTV
ncbi:MAG: GNAT family N-acetyltransferase [Clostridiales bacterium]|nr:GNAT family N-acetyltransferase [Clostridiales bacterium]